MNFAVIYDKQSRELFLDESARIEADASVRQAADMKGRVLVALFALEADAQLFMRSKLRGDAGDDDDDLLFDVEDGD